MLDLEHRISRYLSIMLNIGEFEFDAECGSVKPAVDGPQGGDFCPHFPHTSFVASDFQTYPDVARFSKSA